MEVTSAHDTDEPTVSIGVEIRLPAEQARTFLRAMTGNDDDVLLVAERAIRDRLGEHDAAREVELDYADGSTNDVRDLMETEAATNDRREALYGPVA